GQFLAVRLDQLGKADHHLLALDWRQARPDAGLEACAGHLYGRLSIRLIAAGHLTEHTAIHRTDAVERGAGHCRAKSAVDEGAAFDYQSGGTLFPIAAGQAHGGFLLFCGAAGMRRQVITAPYPVAESFSIFFTAAHKCRVLRSFYQTEPPKQALW